MNPIFDQDYELLSVINNIQLNLSHSLSDEVCMGGLNRYKILYSYFWSLISKNKYFCTNCDQSNCFNRYFLKELKQAHLSENDLYILCYITTYFLDLIMSRGVDLSQAYYILSRGHKYVFSFILNKKRFPKSIKSNTINNYQGYLLSVLYYMIPNFKYLI